MNYKLHYDLLIKKAKGRNISKEVYSENHHIVPKSEGGTDDKTNMVKLYPREHFLAHWLLYRENPTVSRAFAFTMMCTSRNGIYKTSSRTYQEGVEAAAKAHSKNFKGRKAIYNESLNETKFVKDYELDTYYEMGWRLGQKKRPDQKWYNNGTITKQFTSEKVPNGWLEGRLSHSRTKNRKAMSKNGKVKFIDTNLIQQYENDGWVLGNEKYYPGYLHQKRNQKS